jgi:hypothetical protein
MKTERGISVQYSSNATTQLIEGYLLDLRSPRPEGELPPPAVSIGVRRGELSRGETNTAVGSIENTIKSL